MHTYKYRVHAFRQQESSPVQVSFVAYSADILEWAGVPRKSDELLTGFQRFRDQKRIDGEIVPFFQDPHNCSPTAIIVGLRKDSPGIGGCRLETNNIPVGEMIETTMEITFGGPALDGDGIFQAALGYVNDRLERSTDPPEAPGGEASASESSDEELEDDDAVDEPKGEDTDDEEDEDEAISHLGSQTLARMKVALEDQSNWKNPSFREAIGDYVKPAFLIDGQHRASAGARFGKRGLPFIVCGLYGAPWEEQVFQFTVVNLRPKKIAPSLITAIAGLSLTRGEQNRVELRLDQAGVKIKDVRVMSLVAYDPESPFQGLINMAVGQPEETLLGFGSLKRIAKVWYRASRTSLTQIAKKAANVKNTAKAREQWRESEDWFVFFCAFWQAVRDGCEDSLWVPGKGNRLLVGANLWALQEVLLGAADGQVASVWDRADSTKDRAARVQILKDALLEVVNTTIGYFPEDLWTTDWGKGSQDTTSGRKDVAEFFERIIDEGKKRGGVWKNWQKDKWLSSRG